MKLFAARMLSRVLHPVIFGLLIPFLVIYHTTADFRYGVKWMLFSSLFVFLSIFVYFLFRPRDFLQDIDVSKREKRPLFYSISLVFAVCYFIAATIIKGLFFPLSIVALGIIIAIILFEIANFYIKVSIHAAVVAAYVVTLGILYGFIPFLIVAWMPPAICWSRVVLHKHTRKEVLSGTLLGILITLITFAVGELLL